MQQHGIRELREPSTFLGLYHLLTEEIRLSWRRFGVLRLP
jgi:hypothetical protein